MFWPSRSLVEIRRPKFSTTYNHLNWISDCNQKTRISKILTYASLLYCRWLMSTNQRAAWHSGPISPAFALSLLSQTGPVNHSVREGAEKKIWIQRLNTDNSKNLINYLFYRYQYERGKNFTARQDQKYTSKRI